jgi:hypothetical protein
MVMVELMMLTEETVEYGPKTVTSSLGLLYHVQVVMQDDRKKIINKSLSLQNLQVFGSGKSIPCGGTVRQLCNFSVLMKNSPFLKNYFWKEIPLFPCFFSLYPLVVLTLIAVADQLCDGDGVVNIYDLSILLFNWTK